MGGFLPITNGPFWPLAACREGQLWVVSGGHASTVANRKGAFAPVPTSGAMRIWAPKCV